jgi:hypothetical protein
MSIPTPLLAASLFALSLLCTVALIIAGAPVPDELKSMLTLFAGAAVGSVAPAAISVRRR